MLTPPDRSRDYDRRRDDRRYDDRSRDSRDDRSRDPRDARPRDDRRDPRDRDDRRDAPRDVRRDSREPARAELPPRRDERSPRPDQRNGSRSGSHAPSSGAAPMEDVKPTGAAAAEEEGAEDDDTDAMARMMGFGGFGSTSGKKVGGNDEVGSTNVKKERKWRQVCHILCVYAEPRSTCTGYALTSR